MKIGIDISQIVYQGTGVGRFTRGLVETILEHDHHNHWLFFFSSLRQKLDRELENKIKHRGFQLVKWKLPPTILSVLFNKYHHFSKLLTFNFKRLTSLDWFITSDWIEPPLSVNKATIVHDLTVFRYPQTVDKKIFITQKMRLKYVKNESKIIFSDSQTTKNDLIEYLKIKPQKIIVNYPGVSIAKTTKKEINSVLEKYHLNKPFLLTVGKIEPRKNFPRLIEAFIKLNDKNINLVIIGPKGWQELNHPEIKKHLNIKFLGLISDSELSSLYSSSLLFVYPSLWEGFGYPLVEAMKLKTPIACSNIPIFKEIARNNAVYFDPFSTEEIAKAIKNLMEDQQLRKKLIEGGKIRAKEFDWKRYWEILITTLNNRK